MCLLKKTIFILVLLLLAQNYNLAQSNSRQTTWVLDKAEKIGNNKAFPLNTRPEVKISNGSKYLLFNGIDNALLVKNNPLGNAAEFTIEVILRPDSSLNPDNLEQRFLHIGNSAGDKERILLELRLLKNQKWALDVFMSSENSSITFLDTVHTKHLYPAGKWYNVTLVFKNSAVTSYINGGKDSTDTVVFHSLPNAQISIGARQNPKSWFKGGIKTIRFTKRALKPAEFLKSGSDLN
jgi:hypothetical protein